MSEPELMRESEVHAFGVEIVFNQLEKAEWVIQSADALAERTEHPQIVATKDGEFAFFIVRTAMYPGSGLIEGEDVFRHFVQLARDHGASCYFASVGIANSKGTTDEEMTVPVKGVAYHVAFEGLVKMDLPPEN